MMSAFVLSFVCNASGLWPNVFLHAVEPDAVYADDDESKLLSFLVNNQSFTSLIGNSSKLKQISIINVLRG